MGIELTLSPIMFIIVGGAKIVEHYRMVDEQGNAKA
jgi:hypothetical protein